ncbi:MAG: hypothetical protein UR68_C0006G0009 [Candidatus Roizmanbacteria bacterium GW2011_GWA2_35_19]|uniref:Uncharacterized protein n=2 Tax=Candidatus Roizmaniibacteriota TaxID=1752723 RepID=A0A0G0F1D8_9BACT|nr:MAG: hypothetical protein UR63_C0015G0008 [Candidatus Roizmanbacteria bacterium GW2011_GWC2_35_12]KKP73192.1 MAG: hypothetical protein UR68_C0006G0009 [Candidatus Roizmanbacteria bacterium GW2011_GWA2_35_19]
MAKKILFFCLIFFALTYLFIITLPQNNIINSASLTSASATLSNSRLSYRAGVATGAIGSSIVTIDASGNADNDTHHLFPKDTVCFAGATLDGCYMQNTYVVSSIPSTTTFNITTALGGTALGAADLVIATQSGSLTIAFTTVNEVPLDGDILVTIPALDADTTPCDGFPDTAATAATNGFDMGDASNRIAAADITVTGCTDGNWVATETITCGTSSTDHTIRIDRQTALCVAPSAITITVDSSPGLINPAPINSGHTQGTADLYTINVRTRDGSDNTIDQVNMKVAPVEAVFVSATVDESLSFTVAGVTADSGTTCNITRTSATPDSTAYSIPWGTISSTYATATHNTAQQLTVSTNASAGYKVYAEENDQMGRDGNVCTGATPSAGEFTFSSGTCIRDTACGATPCTHQTSQDWTDMATYVGFGYSLENQSGTDAEFLYNESSRTFSAKQLADQEASESRSDSTAEIMNNTVPVSGSSIYVCYRIAIPGTQPAGYYYNKVKYTAVPTF